MSRIERILPSIKERGNAVHDCRHQAPGGRRSFCRRPFNSEPQFRITRGHRHDGAVRAILVAHFEEGDLHRRTPPTTAPSSAALGQLFYVFRLGEAVPEDHLVRKIDTALDLSWLRGELAPHYSSMGRPSIDPELMIRMLVVGYVFAIRSERLICREVQVNLAYRWFCRLGIEDAVPDHSAFSRARNERFREEIYSVACSNVSLKLALRPVWLVAKALRLTRA